MGLGGGLGGLAYSAYERRLANQIERVPRHVGVILDGNRRWAKASGEHVSRGHEAGADKITEFLGWCEDAGVDVVTLWLLSTDNLNRPANELSELFGIIERAVTGLAATGRWRVHPVGAHDLLPAETAQILKQVDDRTRNNKGLLVNVAIGYGGRREITDAVRAMLHDQAAQGLSLDQIADELTPEHITEYLYTKGQPDPELVIRTSGEQRLSGFLLWQSAHSEFYFCEAFWPDFRRVDFLRALRAYGQRQRRFGA